MFADNAFIYCILTQHGLNCISFFSSSGVYECITAENSMPYIIWQSIMIPDPNIQVNFSKVVTCSSKVPLQCCVQQSYSVTWITLSSEACSESGHVLFITVEGHEQTNCLFRFSPGFQDV